ncbi:hypothetical protein H9Q74_013664 [Fusarium xylarioides]|nr:hypothetical protein H9Q71_013174 [Fusarium xylarioides]KAG5811222.1 hypothetical protein H9Q74_013664 [Fusarium xylarioides]
MLFSSFFAPANSAVALTVLLGFSQVANAAVQCDIISSVHCGGNHHKQNHKLPTTAGSTYYVNGFHGGVMNAKLQSIKQSVPGKEPTFLKAPIGRLDRHENAITRSTD